MFPILIVASWFTGPKPLKCFTPPPDYKEEQSGSSEEEEDEDETEEEEEEYSEEDTGIVRASDKIEDEFLKQVFHSELLMFLFLLFLLLR